MRIFVLLLLFLPTNFLFSTAEEESTVTKSIPKRDALDEIFFAKDLWSKPLAEVKATFEPEKTEKTDLATIPKEILAELKKNNISVEEYLKKLNQKEKGPFQWLSNEKKGLRAPEGKFTLLDMNLGEVIVRSKGTGISDITALIYNRGDNDVIGKSVFEKELSTWRDALSEKLNMRPDDRDQRGHLQVNGALWESKETGTAWLLEGGVNRRESRVEFIRLRMVPLSPSHRAKNKVSRRRNLVTNVIKEENGDVYISGIPMVDQGEKGYCVVASVERVIRYFGSDVDQHEMASLANTSGDGGTHNDDMVKAFQRITGKIHVRTIKHIDLDDRQFRRDVRSYNRLAKNKGAWHSGDNLNVHPLLFWSKADQEIFRKIKGEQTKFAHFNRKIKEFVDQGIPLCWTLFLGMFPEENLPQAWGGHMRLIIGYNEKNQEIIYSDSWGKGHEKKRMRADEAWCMSTGLYTMIPNR